MAKELKNAAKGSINIDGINVETYKTFYDSCNALGVEVGTTGHRGGDTSHGCRTYLRISNEDCTDMRCRVRASGETFVFDSARENDGVEIILGGDCELDTFFEALQFAVDVLGRKTDGVAEYEPSKLEIRQMTFAVYLNELCELYRRTGSLKGMSTLQRKHHVTAVTQQQFFECDLHRATGYVEQDFCNKVYAYILDNGKAVSAPKYTNKKKHD